MMMVGAVISRMIFGPSPDHSTVMASAVGSISWGDCRNGIARRVRVLRLGTTIASIVVPSRLVVFVLDYCGHINDQQGPLCGGSVLVSIEADRR
jgi:hypothetical protein